MIEVDSLAVSYGSAKVFHDVNLRVDEGQIVALIGNNGAGKTTLLRALSGILGAQGGQVVAGTVRGEGLDLDRSNADKIVRHGIVQVPEGRRIFAQLTVQENLMAGALSVRSRSRVAASLRRVRELFPILVERAGQTAGLLSGGEQQMLAIGRALMSEPKVLLMDEPSLGLAPLVARQIMDTITQVNADGTSVLLVEQNTRLALSVAHHAYVLNGGTMAAQGPAADLIDSDMLLELTLGKTTAHGSAVLTKAGGRGDE
ncbi:ABC transporter ATP-binding protein [Rhodococcus sp. ACPA4]|uniref:Amino acid/amide ABC transporter ATP-binding protein 2 (HAAT family) n=1 Tax=Nocardia globerula TaxID=1818 RepID=A0A652YZ60_NOCGL|nr:MULTISPECIES: ABC transporter ATP-binding protein [Rhodococcus]NMD58664.1 ABC transporter ATP-binding protein [Nocardia globerula]KJF19647.1 LIV-I protein F [Rhodococcus sp. AD45]MCE4263839.1 ABC transporter ATP-binding protein [Rhodococcus globerulus]NRI66390.1 ABC transporter ATP-binding protein [Rhodococcus sp. MS16]PBC41351.1 ABC transporter ATP-binding protein [Rhodococcus sp. ACPA4]